VILWDTEAVSRVASNVLIVRHVLGHVSANAGIDQSNVRPPNAQPGTGPAQPGTGPWLLRLPADPDASARALRVRMTAAFGVNVSVLISDSFGRPFRLGTVGVAIGVAGFPAVWDQRGRRDLYGRTLEATLTAPADQLAGACDLLLGQAAERRAAAVVRGIRTWAPDAHAADVCRPAAGDLYL
jgi:coenzyme F420-0:L-glutamate ligase/coenzyme F420-1:gamma-L-glutamate ligase